MGSRSCAMARLYRPLARVGEGWAAFHPPSELAPTHQIALKGPRRWAIRLNPPTGLAEAFVTTPGQRAEHRRNTRIGAVPGHKGEPPSCSTSFPAGPSLSASAPSAPPE